MAELGKSDDAEDEDEFADEGLQNPVDYVVRTWQVFRLHNVLPEAGGYNSQDPSLMEDWGFLNQRFNWWFNTLSDMEDDGDSDALFDGPEGDVPGIQEL